MTTRDAGNEPEARPEGAAAAGDSSAEPIQPTRVVLVHGELSAAELETLLEDSSLCLLDVPGNRAALAELDARRDRRELAGVISFAPRGPDQRIHDWLRSALVVLDDHHDGWYWTRWATIDVRGLEATPQNRAVAGDFGRVLDPDEAVPFRIQNIDHED